MYIVCYFEQCLWVNCRNAYFNSRHYKILNQNVQITPMGYQNNELITFSRSFYIIFNLCFDPVYSLQFTSNENSK